MTDNQQPAYKNRSGQISVTVWKNARKTKDGREFTAYDTTINRSYKDNNDEWQTTDKYQENDLPRVARLAQHASEFIDKDKANKE